MNKFLWGIIAGTKGGINRARMIDELKNRPYNINQLAEKLSLDYKTVKHHIHVLEKNDIITSTGKQYGTLYFLSDKMEENYDTFQEIMDEFGK
jgi:predicted transcriptional regulator